MDETRAIATVAATDVTPDQPRSRGRRIGFVLLGLAVVALVLGGVYALLNLGGGGGSQVVVPDLTGQTVVQAQQSLEAKHLELGQVTKRESDTPADRIIDQDPSPPASISEGSAVNVVVSLGPAKTKVPVITGLLLDQALNRLDAAKLVAGTRTFKSSDQPENTVIEVDPVEGTEVAQGSTVNLVLSNGKVKVPNVVGEQEAQAKADLSNAGLNFTTLRQPTTDPTKVGTVLAQNPTGGTAKAQSIVTITIGSAAPSPSPTLTPTPTPSIT